MFKSTPTPFLTLTGLLLTLLLWTAPALRAAAASPPPPNIPLLIGDSLDEQGKQRPLTPARRKLFDALEKELGVRFAIRMYPWPRAERYAMDGNGLIFGLPKNADRLRLLRYSDAAARNNLWLVTRSDAAFPYNSLDDLRGKTIGIVRAYYYGDAFEHARSTGLFHTDEDISSRGTRLTRLMLRRVDAILLYQPNTQTPKDVETELRAFMAPRLKGLGAAANAGYRVLPRPVATDAGLCFAIARDKDDGIIARINAALARVQQHPPN